MSFLVNKIKSKIPGKQQTLDWFTRYQVVIAKKIKRYTWTGLLMTEYLALRGLTGEGVQIKPEIIVAGIPVWHINKLGHAMSDEILKYRSMGGIFLAHQKGGKQTFHFTARIFGPMRFVTYKLLEALQLLGSEDAQSVTDLTDVTSVPGLDSVDLEWIDQKGNIVDVEGRLEAGALGSPLIDWTRQSEFANEEYAFHRTFPIITDTKIYTDMYLETLVARENVKFGKNVLEIECAFRQFTAPIYFQKTVPNEEGSRKYYSTFIPKDLMIAIERIENVINILWAGLMTFYYEVGELRPDLMYQKPYGKDEKEGTNLIMTMIAHWVASRSIYSKSAFV